VAAVDILDAGADPQPCRFEQAVQTAVLPVQDLPLQEQCEAVFEGQFLGDRRPSQETEGGESHGFLGGLSSEFACVLSC
jgi:hypothetical protein